MKKTIKTITIIVAIGNMLLGAYVLGTTQADTVTAEYLNDIIDMRNVANFTADEYDLMIYLDDGNGYYWER